MTAFTIGQRVRVVDHPTVTGFEGEVTKITNDFIEVNLEVFGRTARTDLKYSQCEPVEPPAKSK